MTSKNTLTAVLLTAVFCLPAAYAEESSTKPVPATAMGGMGGMDMSSMMMSDDKLKMKQEHLLKMHEFSTKIVGATDPKEKERLKAEQLQLMKDHEKQHHQMMQQHMQEMMKQRGGMSGMEHGGPAGGGMGAMPGMQHGGPSGGMGNMPGMQHGGNAGGEMGAMPGMQHGNTPATPPSAPTK